MTLKIQIASDLHIEFYDKFERIPNDIIIPNAPVLALLGDIGLACTDQLKDFLYQQADRFETVLFVLGNHEFYNTGGGNTRPHTVDEQLAWVLQVCNQRKNLFLLEKQSIDLQGVRILGTSLWSDIPPDQVSMAEGTMNDYNLCYKKDPNNNNKLNYLRADDTRQWHKDSVAWLEKEIADCREKKKQPVLVLTHHTPLLSGTSHPKYDDDALQCCFSTNLTHLLQQEPVIKAWCCGHTHYNFDFVVHTTRILSNQRGYVGDICKGYNNAFVLEM